MGCLSIVSIVSIVGLRRPFVSLISIMHVGGKIHTGSVLLLLKDATRKDAGTGHPGILLYFDQRKRESTHPHMISVIAYGEI